MSESREILIDKLLNIPNECIINKVISKEMFYEEGQLNSSDKKIFTDLIRQIKWYAKFSESTIRIPEYSDDKREYLEILIINVILKDENISKTNIGGFYFKQDKKINRFIDLICRFIPYPLIVVIQYKKELQLSVSHISNHLSDYSKITLDEIINTGWIDTENMGDLERELFDNIQLDNLDFTNCYLFYQSYINNIIKYNGAKIVGESVSLNPIEVHKINCEIEIIDKKIVNLLNEVKKSTVPFNEQAVLNMEIKKLKDNKKSLEEKLIKM